MKRCIVYLLAVVLLLSVLLAGCGSVENKVVGAWYAVSAEFDGYPVSPSKIGMGSSDGDYIFYSDGTYQSALSWDQGTWSVDGETVILYMDGSSKSTKLTYKDGQLILNNSELRVVYEKK